MVRTDEDEFNDCADSPRVKQATVDIKKKTVNFL